MTQQEVTAHPFWQRFQARLPVVINGLVQRGMISPNVQGVLINIIRNSYPAMHQLIENLNMRYSEIADPQIDQEIFQWLQPFINQAMVQVRQMTGGYGVGFSPGPGFMGGPRPVGFGYDSGRGGGMPGVTPMGIPTSPFGGGAAPVVPRGDLFQAPGSPTAVSPFNGTAPKTPTQRDRHVAEQMKPKVDAPVAPPEWKSPELESEDTYEMNNVIVQMAKFALSTGDRARRVIVHDSKVGYVSDNEVLGRYKGIFDMFPDSRRKFISIAYQQLKMINVGRDEFMKIANAMNIAVSKAASTEAKLRAIIASSGHFSVKAYSEFNKLFIDELYLHIENGELCDSFHPKNILNRPSKIEEILAWVTGDIDKAMLDALRGMDGFEKRLDELLTVVIDTTVSTLPKRIIDITRDMTMLDDFYRALPGMWSEDGGISFKNTEDLVNVFLATRETIDGSKSSGAVSAESTLKTLLTNLSGQFCMIFLPRMISWCNYSKADVCRYDEKGNCQPACFSKLQPRNDVEFFVNENLDKWTMSKDQKFRWAPKNLLLEIDEETYLLQYGRTTNDCSWIGTSRYWR